MQSNVDNCPPRYVLLMVGGVTTRNT